MPTHAMPPSAPSLPPPLLAETLHRVARRYRLPAMEAVPPNPGQEGAAATVALTIEQARRTLAAGGVPDEASQSRFVDALARMIEDAMRTDAGDPVFQAMVLRHRFAQVREYASLSAHADADRRSVRAAVNKVAHPARPLPSLSEDHRQALARLHASAAAGDWPALADTARGLMTLGRRAQSDTLQRQPSLARLLDSPALERLRRLHELAPDAQVRRYRSLWERQGPRSGSASAAAHGIASQQRGAAVEALATQAIASLAQRLAQAEDMPAAYRAVTSMRVPAAIRGERDRAKSEWDVVLLRRAGGAGDTPLWDICLLVEAKASADAATTDLPRLLRGLRLLAQADDSEVYAFQTREGVVRLRGASLRTLGAAAAELRERVLYCCDAPADPAPRLLGAASRMQLLSAPPSVAFACRLAQGEPSDRGCLAPLWRELLESPRWHAVLHQYPTLRQVRDLMVHTDDLTAAIERIPPQATSSV
ncbi:3-deoxy-D-arabino-heptulosonate 7-phosphate synthase [Bordetella genomosp. 9]|uniref:3-deoxy-D-arabino-heptulosonate 7-phosphate synthase n=1 Tax=Bordetella genomosp. 9 TaxID=1416803 RepID=UPI000A29193D|nr:3-deoxy-D-arabino-heptulosonate 7-phosphate synthase [Bordetella genomosp. 9]ARP90749.1 3-deoxy-D-arabino-heptulosonate 7-phosphate synthase [Bordetella genomosp. 9]